MNGYTNSQLTTMQKRGNNDSFNFYAGLGINLTSSQSYDQNDAPVGTRNISVLPRAVAGINAYANPNTRRLVFYAELSITDKKYKDSFLEQTLVSIRSSPP